MQKISWTEETVPKPTTAQEAFDLVCAHLRQQGVRATQTLEHDSACLYRTGSGAACAVGLFLTDAKAYAIDHVIGGAGFRTLMMMTPSHREIRGLAKAIERLEVLNVKAVKPGWPELGGALQQVHDSERSWNSTGFSGEGEDMLDGVAGAFGLVYTKPVAK